jgi:hypothetical protein
VTGSKSGVEVALLGRYTHRAQSTRRSSFFGMRRLVASLCFAVSLTGASGRPTKSCDLAYEEKYAPVNGSTCDWCQYNRCQWCAPKNEWRVSRCYIL